MKKNDIRGFIILAIVFVIFSVIAFAVPFEMNAGFWMSYVFGVIAIAVQAYVFTVAFKNGEDAKSRFYGFPIAKIGIMYLLVQMVVSLLGMILSSFVPTFPNWVLIIVDVIILGIAAIGCITAETMRDEIEKQDVTLKKDVSNMRKLQSLTASFVDMSQDDSVKKTLQDMADEFRYSDPVSLNDTIELENELESIVGEVQRALIDGDVEAVNGLCMRAKASLAERNRVCKLGK